jgi:hypothetical protein
MQYIENHALNIRHIYDYFIHSEKEENLVHNGGNSAVTLR